MHRRNLLVLAGLGSVSLAGCLGSGNGDDDNEATTDDGTSDESQTDSETSASGTSDENEPTDSQPGDDNDDHDNTDSDKIAALQSPELHVLEYDCYLNDDPESEPTVRGADAGFEFGTSMIMEDPERIYPTVLDIEQEPSENTIRVLTGVTDEVPDGYEGVADNPDANSEGPENGAECVEWDDPFLHMRIHYGVLTEDPDRIPVGTRIQWDMEHPDGSVEELYTFEI